MNSVDEYQSQFEELSNQVTGLTEEWLISLFVAGLQEHLKCELLLAKPPIYVAAVSMAKLFEQKYAAVHKQQKQMTFKRNTGMDSRVIATTLFHSRASSPRGPSQPIRTTGSFSPQQSQIAPSSMGSNSNQFKRLSATEIRQRREKGLCYYCDEKYSPTHRC